MPNASSGSLSSVKLMRLISTSLTASGSRTVSGDSKECSGILLATKTSPFRGSNTQPRGGVAAAVEGAAVAAPLAAGIAAWAKHCTVFTTAVALAAVSVAAVEQSFSDTVETAAAVGAFVTLAGLEENLLCCQASRLILRLSLSGRFLPFF